MQKTIDHAEKARVRINESEITKVVGICETVFSNYTSKQLEAQRSNINKARKGNKIPFVSWFVPDDFKGIKFEDLEKLMDSVSSIPGSSRKEEDLRSIMNMFPDEVIEVYAKKITHRDEALEVFKEEYSSASREFRENYYIQLKNSKWGAGSWLESTLHLDTQLELEEGQESMRFPVLDFYRLLLLSYDAKNPPPVFGAVGLAEVFIRIVDDFITRSHEIAVKARDFEHFDAIIMDLKSLDAPVVLSR